MTRPLQTLAMLGLLGGAGSVSAAEDIDCEGTDLSSLQDAWNIPEKHYEVGEGEICIDGLQHDWRVSLAEVTEKENFPTNERVVVEVAQDLDEATDLSNLHFMGWGEPTAMLEGDYLVEAMNIMHEKGWENPAYLGLNTAGRGTEAYINSDRLSDILMREEWDDGRELIVKLSDSGMLAQDIVINGHSMGGMVGVAAASQLADLDGYNVRSVAHWMPASDQTLRVFKPKFIGAVTQELLPAVKGLLTGGGIVLDEASYDKTMFADGSTFDDNYDRAVPDSARRFVSCTLGFGPKIHDELLKDDLAETRHFVIRGENDPLMAEPTLTKWAKLLDNLDLDVQSMVAWGLPHAFPVNANDQQKRSWHALVDRIVPEAGEAEVSN